MDICYYQNKISDELAGAKEYIELAMSWKKKNPERAKMYADMSTTELGHAANLIKMFEDDCQKVEDEIKDDDLWLLQGLHKNILYMYTEHAAKVKHMHELYAGK